MRMITGPDWAAQVPMDLLQRGVTTNFAVTVQCVDSAQMAAELTRWLSASGHSPWQEDVIIRWTHLDYVGYTEYRIPWAALRVESITHAGAQTLHILFAVHGAEMVASAIRDQPRLLWPDGRPVLWPDHEPVLLVLDPTHHLVLSHPNLLWPIWQMIAWGASNQTITLASAQLNPHHN
jgi:hypothetical protein